MSADVKPEKVFVKITEGDDVTYEVKNLTALAKLVGDRLRVPLDRLLFCIRGVIYFAEDLYIFDRPDTKVVVIVRRKLFVQVLSYARTNFYIWVHSNSTKREELLKKVESDMKVHFPVMATFSAPFKHLIYDNKIILDGEQVEVDHESLAVVIPQLNYVVWHVLFLLVHIFFWFPYLFAASFVGKEALQRWCPKRVNKLMGSVAKPQNFDYGGRDAERRAYREYTVADEARHRRYTPGNNPHGEDLTIMARQGLLGL